MRKQLEFQADRIEAVLAVNELPAKVTGGTVTPRWIRFTVLPDAGAKISKIKGLSEELAAALNADVCRVSRRGAAVAVEIPRSDPGVVEFRGLHKQLMLNSVDGHYADEKNGNAVPSPVTALLGLDEDGAPLLIRLPSKDVGHILISGEPGAGKTNLLQGIILSLALTNKPESLVFCLLGDGLKGMMRSVLERMGFLTIVALAETWSALPVFQEGGRVIIAADDVGIETGSVAIHGLSRVMGVQNLHCVLAWENIPPPEVVNLFKVKIVGRVSTCGDARVASGWMGTGAERLESRGDFLVVAEGRVSRFQAAHISPGGVQETKALSTSPAPGQVSLPWPAGRLTEVFRGGA